MRKIMIMLLVAMLFASNAAANSENAHMCSALDDYYTQKIYDGIIGYPCYKVTEINDNMIGIMGRSDDYRSNDNFRHYTIAESGKYIMMVIDEHENMDKKIKISDDEKDGARIRMKILDCFEDEETLYMAVYKSILIGFKYEGSYLMIGMKNGEQVFTKTIGDENVKNIYKGENDFLFVCEEDGKIILKKINEQGEIDVIDYIGDTNRYNVISTCESQTDYYMLIETWHPMNETDTWKMLHKTEYIIKKISKGDKETKIISALDNRTNNTTYIFDGMNCDEEGIYVYGFNARKNNKTKEMICCYDEELAIKWDMVFEMTYESTHIVQIELMPGDRMICLVRERPITIIEKFKSDDSKIQILAIDDNKNVSVVYDGYDDCFAIKYFAGNLHAFWYGNLDELEDFRRGIYMTRIPIKIN